ncbi:MAG: glycerophosphodiester phosphodiesterase family protein [Eubacteriales bacterium]|nr:glycerophosphodiester phosphodiesterase family protein [Eubacteriales bacterium]
MSDTAVKSEKKKWSKKKKAIVIVLCVLLALIVLVVAGGIYALNWYCKTADYEVVSTDKQVTLVAHRGMRSVAPENTTAAFEQAGEHGYWGAECDIYRTADGVWIVSHDTHTYRMMDKSAFVEKKTYDELMEMTVDNGSNIQDYPDLKFCSLEEYLQICVKYNMTAVIELKGENNTEYYNEVVDLVNQYNAKAVYISFHFENLQKIRALTDDQVYYLVKEITDEDIELAKSLENCGIDFDGNRDENFETDIISKCQDEGLAMGAWTINTLESMDRLVDNGVTLITTDCITK